MRPVSKLKVPFPVSEDDFALLGQSQAVYNGLSVSPVSSPLMRLYVLRDNELTLIGM